MASCCWCSSRLRSSSASSEQEGGRDQGTRGGATRQGCIHAGGVSAGYGTRPGACAKAHARALWRAAVTEHGRRCKPGAKADQNPPQRSHLNGNTRVVAVVRGRRRRVGRCDAADASSPHPIFVVTKALFSWLHFFTHQTSILSRQHLSEKNEPNSPASPRSVKLTSSTRMSN